MLYDKHGNDTVVLGSILLILVILLSTDFFFIKTIKSNFFKYYNGRYYVMRTFVCYTEQRRCYHNRKEIKTEIFRNIYIILWTGHLNTQGGSVPEVSVYDPALPSLPAIGNRSDLSLHVLTNNIVRLCCYSLSFGNAQGRLIGLYILYYINYVHIEELYNICLYIFAKNISLNIMYVVSSYYYYFI